MKGVIVHTKDKPWTTPQYKDATSFKADRKYDTLQQTTQPPKSYYTQIKSMSKINTLYP